MPTINNRIIKFRIWSPSGKIMFTPNFTYPDVDKTCDWVMMQYIGLKDKNGLPICEGDIVKFHYFGFDGSETDNNEIGSIKYDNEFASFIIETKNGNCFFLNDTSHYGEPCIEIIGNIFQNSDLLK